MPGSYWQRAFRHIVQSGDVAAGLGEVGKAAGALAVLRVQRALERRAGMSRAAT